MVIIRFTEKNAQFTVDNFPSLLLKKLATKRNNNERKERPLKNAQKEPGATALDGLGH
jgi:hypothetical protein